MRPPQLVVGAKSVLRALDTGTVRVVLLAGDAPEPTTEPVRRLAAAHGLQLRTVATALELGRWCGVDRPVAAAAELAAPG